MEQKSLVQDKVFRRIVVYSTGLGLSLMLASLASIRIGRAQGLQFTWHWSILVWMGAAVIWNWRFWQSVWDVYEQPSDKTRRKLVIYSILLIALGLAAFLYPIRFISEAYRPDISRGLVTAALFLGILAWFLYKFGRAFVESDEQQTGKTES
jgi:hypothetical protein